MSKINLAKEKLMKEAESHGLIAKTMARQISDMIKTDATADCILKDDKKLMDLKKNFDKYAREHKEGNESCVPPDEADRMIREYYGIIENKTADIIDITKMF